MDFHMSEAEFSRADIERAERAERTVVVVADRTNLGLRALVRAAGFDAIDTLITDSEPNPAPTAQSLPHTHCFSPAVF